jgi:hypothetical protein
LSHPDKTGQKSTPLVGVYDLEAFWSQVPWWSMNNVFAAIFIGFVVLALVYIGIGGSFDRRFWLDFLPGLMENLTILAVAIFVIDRIFKKERLDKLVQTNAGQSRFILLVSNLLAYKLLEYLALATKDEVGNDPELNFEFALERFKGANLEAIFYEKLMESENKEAYTEGFTKILSSRAEGISKALDKIYPRPDPTIGQISEEMISSIGMLDAFKSVLLESFKKANAQVSADEQLKPEQLDLLIKIAFVQIGPELQKIQSAIIQLSEKAKANELFIRLD